MYPIGKSIEEIETPALLLDLDKFQWNVDKMFKFANEAGVNVRPHAKTFKAAAICNKLMEAGAIGLMTQKLSEAEVLLHSGVLFGDKNILISQEMADPVKARQETAALTRYLVEAGYKQEELSRLVEDRKSVV